MQQQTKSLNREGNRTSGRMWFAAVAAIAIAGAISLALVPKAAGAEHRTPRTPARLSGSWTVTVQQVDCTTGDAIGDPFLSMLSFAAGGTATETTSNPMFYPSERGPGHGVWSQTGATQYYASTNAFITTNGVLSAIQTITQTIAMTDDPNSFQTTKAAVEFFSPDGTLIKSGCATAAGARIQ